MPAHVDVIRPDDCFNRLKAKIVEWDFDDPVDFADAAGELCGLGHYVFIRAALLAEKGVLIVSGDYPDFLNQLLEAVTQARYGGVLPDFVLKIILNQLKEYFIREIANPDLLDKAAALLASYIVRQKKAEAGE